MSSTHQLCSSGPHENFDCGMTSFQTSNFLCAESNAQITVIYFVWEALRIIVHREIESE